MIADEDFWDDILAHVKQRVLVPIVGPELLTVPDGAGGRVTLSQQIGQRLAERYKLPIDPAAPRTLNDWVRAYIAANGRERPSGCTGSSTTS